MVEEHIPKDFNGVVLVKSKGKIVLKKAYGNAELVHQVPNTITTKFPTASLGKAFIAVAIMKLIEDNMLSLKSTIGSILTFDLQNIDVDVTIEQLLSHTSGVPDYFDEETMQEYSDLFIEYPNYKVRSSKDLLPLFINKPMMYSKGEKFQYNNTGFVLLGLIIEAISNKPFDQFITENIFIPLQMHNTGYYEMDCLPLNCATGYIWDTTINNYRSNIYSIDVKGTGAGGAYTTLEDIKNFWEGLVEGKVIAKKTFMTMITSKEKSNNYGYGFWIYPDKVSFIQGCDPGISCVSSFNIEKQLLIVIISNKAQDVWSIHRKIRESNR